MVKLNKLFEWVILAPFDFFIDLIAKFHGGFYVTESKLWEFYKKLEKESFKNGKSKN